MASPAVLIVRVLTGPRTGSEVALPGSGRASIGHEYWHDVVVRDASTRGCAVEIEATDGVARLTVLDGTALLLGSTLRTGDTAVLPTYVPLSLGDIAFAYGEAGSPRWDDAAAIVAQKGPAAVVEPGEAPAPGPGLLDSARDSLGARLGQAFSWRAVLGLILLAVVALGTGPAIDALQLGGTPAERTQSALLAAGYGNVRVKDSNDGNIVVGGYVPTEADRQRVQSMIDAKGLRATMAIETGDETSRSASDVARMNGVETRSRPLGSGIIELTTPPIDPDARAKLEAMVRRDVPSLRRIVFREDEALGAPDEVKTVADATKRVSSVVGGDPGYILTVDGARYFPGAILPSGHRLVAIAEQTVVLERNGHQVKLKF